jgi:transposase
VIPPELEAEILRLLTAEHWPVGTIARSLSVHHYVVERVARKAGLPAVKIVRPRRIDPFVEFVRDTWRRYPKIPASRLYAMCRERGYEGNPSHFRHVVSPLRPKPPAEAFLRLRTLPGEQAQADWAHFGTITIGQAVRQLLAFVIVLAYSRAIFMRFFLGQCLENLLRGHDAAFQGWGGCPRAVLYDNPKTIVIERVGQALRMNPLLLDFANAWRYEPRPVPPYRANEKGRVERAIRYARSGFFMARRWRDLDDLNAQADEWCQKDAMGRPWPDDPTITVRDAFEKERPLLLPPPENPPGLDERREVVVGKTPYVRFDKNDYSVPHRLVHETVVVTATPDTVRVLHQGVEVARHRRTYDCRQLVEDASHVEALALEKRAAREHRTLDRVSRAAPSSRALIERLAERGNNLGYATRHLLRLLDLYGAEAVERAIRVVLARDVPHVHGVEQVLEVERSERGLGPAVAIPLPDDPKLHVTVRPHALSGYDALASRAEHETERKEGDDESSQLVGVAG